MKLLIVDDEELTRTGVISSIDWKALGIGEVLQADDGINGLEMAKRHRPEIILCDVRMPRMTGIAMLERLEKILPDTIPIFMSGYSDKDYLKAAIKLKAVNYIEKPLNPAEIREAVLEAIELYTKKIRSHRGETLQSMENASRLAQLLTTPGIDSLQAAEQLAEELALPYGSGTQVTCVIIRLRTAPEFVQPSPEEIYHGFHNLLQHYHSDCVYVTKKLQFLVYFIFSPDSFSSLMASDIQNFLEEQFGSYEDHFIAMGESYHGFSKAYQAYTSAVILLESSFFFPANSYLTPEISQNSSSAKSAPGFAPESLLSEALSSQDSDKCGQILKDLEEQYFRNTQVLPDQTKDLYYKLFLSLENARRQQKLPLHSSNSESMMSLLENCFTFQELHNTLCSQVDNYFSDLQDAVPENSTIFLIRDYISKNYGNETLSVKDISDHVFLSASYVCTFFKNETGQTLNQYLTEFRMEKAKALLADPRYKIADISSRVGYSDGNYFGKSFRKYTGLSPSEYREKSNR